MESIHPWVETTRRVVSTASKAASRQKLIATMNRLTLLLLLGILGGMWGLLELYL